MIEPSHSGNLSSPEYITALFTEFLNDLDDLKKSDPALHKQYSARLLRLLSDPANYQQQKASFL